MDTAEKRYSKGHKLVSRPAISRRRAVKVMALSAASLVAASTHAPRADAAPGGKRPSSYKIIYKLNGGTNPADQIKRVKRGRSIAVSALRKPKRVNYVFCGWYSDKTLAKKAVKVRGRADVASRRIYAKWEPTFYPISFNLGGGANPSNQIMKVGRNKKLAVSKLKKPQRRGYSFVGWYLDKKLKKSASSVSGKPDVSKRRVYAAWKVVPYKIKYKKEGGIAVRSLPSKYTIETATFSFGRLYRDGSRFVGWYADSDLTASKSKITKGSIGKLTLYSKWDSVSYWNAHMLEQCNTVNALAKEAGGSSSSFVFVTDMHLPNNALVSPYLAKQVVSKTAASMVVFGGDAINFHTKRQNAVDMIASLKSMFAGVEFHFVRGNHDGNTYNKKATADLAISDAEILKMTAGTNEVRPAGRLYYYRDDTAKRVRYLLLDSGVESSPHLSSEQGAWMRSRILELGSDWTVVVIVHRFFGARAVALDIFLPKLDTFGEDLVVALDDVYEAADATIAGVLCGHCHRDFYEQPSAKGYPYFAVATTCDAYGKVSSDPVRARSLGTVEEQAFDVVTIDTAHKLIHLTRIGWGHDRCYSYGQEDAQVLSGGSGTSGGNSAVPLRAASLI